MAKQERSQKKNITARLSLIGLWVSGLALLATIVLLIIKFLTIAKIYTLSNSVAFNWALWISSALIILGLAFYTLLVPQRVREFLVGRQARYGSNALIMLLAFIGILLVVNIMVYENPGKPRDFTEDKQNSLAPETLDTLKALPSPVTATGFFTVRNSNVTAGKLLENYKNHSNGKFEFKFVDPEQNPLSAQQAGITGDGKIYLQMGDSHEIAALASEQEITSALIRMMNPGKRTIYFLTGHGERDIQNASNLAYTSAKSALEAKNYTVQNLNLITQNKIPDNAKVIVIAGPLQPISAAEQTLLQDYIGKGGSLVVMEDPTPLTQFGNSPDPLAAFLAANWGINFNNDFVIDPTVNPKNFALESSYGSHPITEKLLTLGSFYPNSRSLTIAPNLKNQPTALVLTASSAWGETDFSSVTDGTYAYNSNTDLPGPLILAAAVSDASTDSNLVVFGDSAFAANIYFNQGANGDIFINSIDWAAGQQQLISLNTPKAISRTFNPPSSLGLLVMAISFLFLLPGLVIAGGVASWLVRRSRG
jgi:ABC-type uncharacterized transport system involved in gliding motility auxiliary subunit